LKGDNWGKYFEAVYGQVPDSGYPICLSDFSILYDDEVQKAGATTPAFSTCPPDESANSKGAYYSAAQGQGLQEPNTRAIFHPPPNNALPANTWVEVIHSAFPEDEFYAAWFFYAKGSGMWYNTGKTNSFNTHNDAFEHYGTTNSDCTARLTSFHDPCLQSHANNEAMSQACAAAGDNSIQFMNHVDGGTCGACCDENKKVSWSIEIVACNMQGINSCVADSGDSKIKAGWMGKRNCECQEGGRFMNCKGVPNR